MTNDSGNDHTVSDIGTDSSITGGTKWKRLPIVTTDRHMREISEDGWIAVISANSPPLLFQRGRIPVRIVTDDSGHPVVEPMSRAAFRGYLDRVADFYVRDQKGTLHPISPPMATVDDMMAEEDLPLPRLKGIVHAPVFTPDGVLITHSGYQAETGFYFQPREHFRIPPVDSQPSDKALSVAKDIILHDLLTDFPFTGQADQAAAIALLLLPFSRLMIRGPTPLHLAESPSAGTGKGLLIDVLLYPALGFWLPRMPIGRNEEEMRKKLTSALMEGRAAILIDNVSVTLDSASLSAALTADTWQDRVLGHSRTVVLPVSNAWAATANNPTLSLEIARRTISIRLDSRRERPWERTGFKHPNLRRWADDNRGNLIWAALTFIQAWIAAGRPSGAISMGSYETYAEVIGGILDVAGIPGFLANRERVYSTVHHEMSAWSEFFPVWWERFGDNLVTGDELLSLAIQHNLLSDIWADRNPHGASTSFGTALVKMRDTVTAGFRVEQGKAAPHTKAARYRLENLRGLRSLAEPSPILAREEKTTSTNETVEDQGRGNPPQGPATPREVVPGQPMPLALFARPQNQEGCPEDVEEEL